MQAKKDHFLLDQNAITKGQCTEFISQQQAQWRTIDELEVPPYKRISAYTRNVQYQPHNTRTFPVLKQALKYLIDTIFPLLFESQQTLKERQHIVLFLEERLIAIRCQYFVQGIICPGELLKILRGMLVVETMRGFDSGNRPLVGLELMMQAEVQQTMEAQFPEQYLQALKMSIVCSKRRDLQKLLLNHPVILDQEELVRILEIKLKIEQNNYHAYYAALEEEQALIRCLLWLQIKTVKTNFTNIIKKAFMDVPAEWLYRRLCLDTQEKDGWISLKKSPQIFEQEGVRYENWIGLEALREVIIQ